MTGSETAIMTENLTRILGRVTAVDGLSLEIPAGIVFGFLGPNGAGKTTTIRLLLGLLEPSNGYASVLGFDTADRPEEIRKRTGALLEHSGLYERLSAEDNLEFYGRVWELGVRERRARIEELLTHLGLWDRRKEHVRTWSRGMKQKLAVARTLLHRPKLVFLDEPTAGLDPVAAAALRDDLSTLVIQEGVTVFLTTHNLAEAEKLCNRVGVISRGKLLALGHPDELRASDGASQLEVTGRGFNPDALEQLSARHEVAGTRLQNGRLIISLKDTNDPAPLVRLLVMAGVDIEEVRRGQASLEEAFLTIMREEVNG
jgi:ABC-2 type transport system ATP-binding protein